LKLTFLGKGSQNDFNLDYDSTVTHGSDASLRITYVGPAIPSKNDLVAECNGVVDHLQASRDGYLADGFSPATVDWAIQNARIVAQYADLQRNPNVRDPDMATNAEWILSQAPPGTRIVLWAHNGHVARTPGAMGSYLAQTYGNDYRVFGFAFHDGQYNAVGAQGLKPYDAVPSFPGSAEYVFHQTGLLQGVLDLRKASATEPGAAWLLGDVMSRSIGAVPVDGFFVSNLAQAYDALIWVSHSTPSVLLPF
jgi:erythromycin esterase